MKKRIVSVVMLIAMMFMLLGCQIDLPFLSKPEDAVKEVMKQENLMELLSLAEERALNDESSSARMLQVLFTIPSMKSYLLDNVRSISYNITDVPKNGKSATVSALITHYDLTPMVEKTIEILAERFAEMDSTMEIPETDEEMADLILPVVEKAIKEAAKSTKPLETYTKVRFTCKQPVNMWTVQDYPDELYDSVLFMNFYSAFLKGIESMDTY